MQTITRRFVLAASVAVAGSAFGLSPATAQTNYPNQTISMICAFPAGSGADVIVRFFAEKIAKVSGATIIVENKPGAGGNIAGQYVTRSKPDGYTIFFHTGSAVAGNMHMFKTPPFDVVKDLQVAATVNKQPHMIAVPISSPIKTMKELTEYLKKEGSNASYAINNTSGKVLAAIYKQEAGLDTVEVAYKSSADSMNDILSGAMAFAAQDPVFSLSQLREGRYRLLAVSSAKRIPGAPDVPTMTESGYPMDQVGWFAMMVPSATPKDIVDKINGWTRQVLAQEDVKKFVTDQGGDVFVSTPKEGQEYLKKEVAAWAGYVKIANIPQQ
ncbi:Bug family tripartite tricarboxylate transporter substrate binding protein [Neorhizobium galegae]|uniref:Extra-cytoplasmic solute receptor n=1 Tax=Neorhizobium galegae bv. orientalis str. HAMBI 540 TaxID=1028800 RepID=A0A068SQ46_NEOGA|nr:tripartite tricarboxylate transporter substrate binding protein [Neorhizobium galegae]CDN48407.1 Extra-cytoplasmic solute receptor [Neorhizobium galegae bv. orientalis str. HAMBI 540]